ncbi:MAG: AmmeMemoRadiSam system protein B [Candidatus Omnitrophica bacterium]|nr:AmmeMemoRadiSam system protein B [Candidatus Omnitrophota bacterium]
MEKLKLRAPAVAGQFYPSSPDALKKQIASFIAGPVSVKKTDAIACMLPHAGYMYSGRVAAAALSAINIKNKIILLGPNHTGAGAHFSIMSQGVWQTPLGQVRIDNDLAQAILENSRYLQEDALAHAYEHSLEVELPLLQYFKSDFQIVPIAFLSDELDALKAIGKEIAQGIKGTGLQEQTLIIASSDMTHYEPQSEAQKKDKEAIAAICELDEDRLMQRVRDLDISMCGYAPAVVMLCAARLLGAKQGKLIKYQTSGEATGDYGSVVGYAGMVII